MTKLFNLARMTTATTGTGTITLGSAASGHITFASAGAVDGDRVSYGIVDGTAAEVGTGTYTASGTTLTRTLANSTTGSLLNLSGSAEVFITDLASDHLPDDPVTVPSNAVLIRRNGGAAAWASQAGPQRQVDKLQIVTSSTNVGDGAGAGVEDRFTQAGSRSGRVFSTGTTSTGRATLAPFGLYSAGFNTPFFVNSVVEASFVVSDLSDAANEYFVHAGLSGITPYDPPGTDAIYFHYSRATYSNHNIRAITRASGTSTTTDTGVAVTAGALIRLRFLYDSTSQVRFWINDSLVATNTTNIPGASATSSARFHVEKTAGTTARLVTLTWLEAGPLA